MIKLLIEELELHEQHQQECLMNMVRICNDSYADPISSLTIIPDIKQQIPQSHFSTMYVGSIQIEILKTGSQISGIEKENVATKSISSYR